MDNLKLKIIILSNFMLGLLIIVSLINAIFFETENQMWFMIINGINISCSVFVIVILIKLSIFFFRLLNQVEKLSKRKIINFLIFILCLILIFLFSFFAYLLLIRGCESKYLLITTLLIFLTYSCRIIIIGSIFIINTVVINTCYTCYMCSKEMKNENRRSDNLDTSRYRV
jgi:amino acid transporter